MDVRHLVKRKRKSAFNNSVCQIQEGLRAAIEKEEVTKVTRPHIRTAYIDIGKIWIRGLPMPCWPCAACWPKGCRCDGRISRNRWSRDRACFPPCKRAPDNANRRPHVNRSSTLAGLYPRGRSLAVVLHVPDQFRVGKQFIQIAVIDAQMKVRSVAVHHRGYGGIESVSDAQAITGHFAR